jgi:acyl carrier protein
MYAQHNGPIALIVITAVTKVAKQTVKRSRAYAENPQALNRTETLTIAGIRPEYLLEQDLGIDSLDFVTLIQDIEANLGYNLNDAVTASARTVGDLILAAESAAQA